MHLVWPEEIEFLRSKMDREISQLVANDYEDAGLSSNLGRKCIKT